MSTVCTACNDEGYGMISIYRHPHKIDEMFFNLTGIQVIASDALCITCYDEMKLANNFRIKCLKSNKNRIGQPPALTHTNRPKNADCETENITINNIKDEIHEIVESSSNIKDTIIIPETLVGISSNSKSQIISSDRSIQPKLQIELINPNNVRTNFFNAENFISTTEDVLNSSIEVKKDNNISDKNEITYEKDSEDLTPEPTREDYYGEIYTLEGVSASGSDGDVYVVVEKSSLNLENFENDPNVEIECIDRYEDDSDVIEEDLSSHTLSGNETDKLDTDKSDQILTKHVRDLIKNEDDIFGNLRPNQCHFCFLDILPNQKEYHVKQHELEDKPYKCAFDGNCASTFKSKSGLRLHVRMHTLGETNQEEAEINDELYLIDEDSNEMDISLSKNGRDDSIDKVSKKRSRPRTVEEDDIFAALGPNQCHFCFIEILTDDKIQHFRDHKLEEKPYKCVFGNDCKSAFKTKSALRIHARIHSTKKLYKCQYCDRTFNQKSNIIAHERLHTGEKPFVCPICSKPFADSGNLKTHIKHHTGERPYQCSVCKKSFRTHYSHKVHMRIHTKERPYACNVCDKTFTSSGKVLVHKRIHTGERPYKCNLCPAAFHESCGLNRHRRNRHQIK